MSFITGPIGGILGIGGSLVGMAAAGAGAAQQAAAATYTGAAQAAMYTYQAGVAAFNQLLAQKEAAQTAAAGVVPLEQAGIAGGQATGAQKAAFGAGNIDPSTGTAAKVQKSTTEATQMTEGVAQFNTEQQVFGQRVQASEQKAQAGMYTSAATTSVEAGKVGAQSAIITGVGNIAQKFVQIGQSIGGFGGGGSTSTTAAGGGIGGSGAGSIYGGGPGMFGG